MTPIPAPAQTSFYAQQQDLIDKFGMTNILQWSDVDGTGILNTVRIGKSLVWADWKINQNFGPPHGKYQIPTNGYLSLLSMGKTLCTDWACWIAADWLYGPRGRSDTTYKNQIEPGLTQALKEMQEAAAGNLIDFGATIGWPVSDAPVSVAGQY
jgi:hypothetical protein